MRGKEAHELAQYATEGITPAYAGKSCGHQCRQYMPQDHPRVCGEKHGAPVSLMCSLGSPPRMRGKGLAVLIGARGAGITPAYAGKRLYLFLCFGQAEDHPRVCGEKELVHKTTNNSWGSPPRMRGKEVSLAPAPLLAGITPAYAGKRLQSMVEDLPEGGSPPRMRGKAPRLLVAEYLFRITPAYAGKSPQLAACCGFHQDHPRVCGEKRSFPDFGNWE